MAYDHQLAERIRKGLARRKGIQSKAMFGGMGFLINGNMMVGVWKTSLIARLGVEDGNSALREPHVRPMDMTGKPMKGWIMVSPAGLLRDADLQQWLDRAMRYVKTLPAK